MYSVRITDDLSPLSSLHRLVTGLSDVKLKLGDRRKVSPAEFDQIMKLRETTHDKAPYDPIGSTGHLFPGTWYLTHIDDKHRRRYERKPLCPRDMDQPIIALANTETKQHTVEQDITIKTSIGT